MNKIIDVTEPLICGRIVVLLKLWNLTINLTPMVLRDHKLWSKLNSYGLKCWSKAEFNSCCLTKKKWDIWQVNSLWNWIWLWRLRLGGEDFLILTFEIPSSYNCNNLLYLFNHQIPQIIPLEQGLTHCSWLIHDSYFNNFGIFIRIFIEVKFRQNWSFLKQKDFTESAMSDVISMTHTVLR